MTWKGGIPEGRILGSGKSPCQGQAVGRSAVSVKGLRKGPVSTKGDGVYGMEAGQARRGQILCFKL